MDTTYAVAARVVYSEPTLRIQLLETLLIAVVFGFVMPPAARRCSHVFKSRPWYGRTFAICKDVLEKMMPIEVPDRMVDEMIGKLVPVFTQHFVGGFLCAPAILGLGP